MSGGSWSAWWSIPGPAAYLDEAIDVLRQGRCLVLALPQHGPPGLEDALTVAVSRDRLWQWTRVDPRDGERPLECVGRACWAQGEAPSTVANLVSAPRLRNRVLWLGLVGVHQWEAWNEWIGEFAHASQREPPRDRAVLVCITTGIPPGERARSRPALAVLEWRGRLDGLDLRVWAAVLGRRTERARFDAELRGELIAELSGGDPLLAEQLADASLGELLEPHALIAEFATRRGWDGVAPALTWESGALALVGGEECVHCAAVTAGPARSALLAERVWRAQMRVLFPLIEAMRRRLIERHRERLSVPFQVEGRRDPITRVEDLEVGHLLWQLRGRIDRHKETLLTALHRGRNALAHLEVLGIAEVSDLLRLLRA